MTNKNKLVVGISLALFAGSAMAANKQAEDDSLLVIFKDQVSKEERLETIRGVGGLLRETDARGRDLSLRHIADGRINKVRVSNAEHRDRVIKRLSQHPLVEVAEPNYILSIHDIHHEFNPLSTPNDTFFADMWALQNTGQQGGVPGADISALAAWDITKGDSSIVIGVIDSGVDYTHPDLQGNMWVNPNEICDNGIDDSGTGVIDDCYGYSPLNDNGDPMDLNGHGTHVAGTIGAVGNNELGVVGVNWNVQMVACQFLDAAGYGSTSDAIECLDYFTNLKLNHGVNLVASNNSWGGGSYSEALKQAITASIDAGIMFVAAAGNDGVDSDIFPSYPASYDLDGIVAVANTTRNDELASLSTYGAESVDLGAPGSEIISTYLNDGYASASGTSMAAPHVAGAAGLVWSISPHLSVTEVKQILMDSGDPISALAGRTVSGNRLNAYQALLDADPEPSFRLSITPPLQEIEVGSYAQYEVEVGSIADWSGEVALTVEVSPELDIELSSYTAYPGDVITATVYTDAESDWGQYDISITATDGEITKEAQASLLVFPAGLIDLTYQNNTPIDIPDNDPAGTSSVINVADEGTLFGTEVTVDITHTWIGDLIVTLISPEGTEHVLHNRSGGSEDDINETWQVATFNGESITGDWTLHVSDNAGWDTGTLNSWELVLTVAGEDDGQPGAPEADFSYSVDGMTVHFSNESEADLDILGYEWDFGDGASAFEANPSHTYAAEGTYNVTLTVWDVQEQSDSVTKTVTVSLVEIDVAILSAVKLRTGDAVVQLTWDGAEGPVDIYRDGQYIDTVQGLNRYRDRFQNAGNSVEYTVCPEGSLTGCGSVTHQF